jgi:hypothetical protein
MRKSEVPMDEKCRNGHPRVRPDGTSNVYVYPPRPGRKPRITCRTCRDGEPVERQSQEERVAKLAEREVAKVVPKKLNAYGELRFWGMCRGISLEKYPLRVAWLMAQLDAEQVADIRSAYDLLERATHVFEAHDGDQEKIRHTATTPSKKEEDDA